MIDPLKHAARRERVSALRRGMCPKCGATLDPLQPHESAGKEMSTPYKDVTVDQLGGYCADHGRFLMSVGAVDGEFYRLEHTLPAGLRRERRDRGE